MNKYGHISVSYANIEWAKSRLASAPREPIGSGNSAGASIHYLPAQAEATEEGRQRISAALSECRKAGITNVWVTPKDGTCKLCFGPEELKKLDTYLQGHGRSSLGTSPNGY